MTASGRTPASPVLASRTTSPIRSAGSGALAAGPAASAVSRVICSLQPGSRRPVGVSKAGAREPGGAAATDEPPYAHGGPPTRPRFSVRAGRAHRWQVFGLAGVVRPYAVRPTRRRFPGALRPVPLATFGGAPPGSPRGPARRFPLTAAGQSRSFTGFPLAPPGASAPGEPPVEEILHLVAPERDHRKIAEFHMRRARSGRCPQRAAEIGSAR